MGYRWLSRGVYRRYAPSMADPITRRELRRNSAKVLRRVERDESLVVTRNGIPVAEVRPVPRQRSLSAKAAVALFASAPMIDPARLRADLDAVVDQDVTPRT